MEARNTRIRDARTMPRKNDVTPRKEPTQGRSKFTVDSILGAAAQILGNLGFDSATTNRIAERAGISIGSLYQYFPNKESLAGALIDRKLEEHAARFEKRLAEVRDHPPRKMIEEMVREIVPLYLDNRKLMRVLATQIPRIDRIPSVMRVRRRVCEILATELRARSKEIQNSDPEMAAFVIINGIMGIIQTTIYDESLDLDQDRLCREIVLMVEGYLVKRE